MLNRLKIENFKAWREVDLAFGKVTGLFGTNSAGKSSLLQFLLLLKQTRNATDRRLVLDFGGPGDMVDLGTFDDAVHQHDKKQAMDWLLEWTLSNMLTIENPWETSSDPLFKDDRLQVRCAVELRSRNLQPRELAYRFNGVEFRLRPKARPKARPKGAFELSTDASNFEFVRKQGRAWPLSHPVKSYLFPSQAKNYFQNTDFLGDFEFEYENLMDSIHYLGPLREHPRRNYHWAGSSPEDVGQRGERTFDAILAATRDKEMRRLKPPARGVRKIPFQKIIAHWLNDLELITDFRLEEIAQGTNLYRAMVRTSPASVQTALTDVGVGVSQVLPALVLLYYVPEGSTVLMEQPEIHLHPAVQSNLADVMLNVAAVRNVQIVIESHSEHLMRRLQRRVAEGDASSEDVKLYFVSSEGSQAHLSDLRLNEWGEIENWPENFFGDEMGEIAAITEASLTRKMERPDTPALGGSHDAAPRPRAVRSATP